MVKGGRTLGAKQKAPSKSSCQALRPLILQAWREGLASPDLRIRLETTKIVAPYAIQKMPTPVEHSGTAGGPIVHAVEVIIRNA